MQRIDEPSLASGSFRQNAFETVRDLGFVPPKRHTEDLWVRSAKTRPGVRSADETGFIARRPVLQWAE